MAISSFPIHTVRIRMYCQGFGDCFLLTFMAKNEQGQSIPVSNMLIDCGVLLGTSDANAKMKAVAQHIQETIANQASEGNESAKLNYLLATHEHWDHLSGFIAAQDIFDQIAVDEVWLSWLEEPGNPIADRLRDDRDQKITALVEARKRAQGLVNTQIAEQIDDMLGFFDQSLGVASGAKSTAAALQFLREKSGAAVRYHRPGETPVTLRADAAPLSGIRVYVLGPPLDKADLLRSDSGKQGVLYMENQFNFLNQTESKFGLVHALTTNQSASANDRMLFPGFMVGDDGKTIDPTADALTKKIHKEYMNAGDAWKRIDSDWLGAAEGLALKLDEDTNNTSLAIAIELIDAKKVLLFPADAQVGNWQSWQKLSWQIDADKVTMNDLFARTVFYKVGHHGSHNATLRTDGLERMTNPNLVAMMPYERIENNGKVKWPSIPHEELKNALKQKTKNRLIVLGEWAKWHEDKQATPTPVLHTDLSLAERQQFYGNLEVSKLKFGSTDADTIAYIDYFVPA